MTPVERRPERIRIVGSANGTVTLHGRPGHTGSRRLQPLLGQPHRARPDRSGDIQRQKGRHGHPPRRKNLQRPSSGRALRATGPATSTRTPEAAGLPFEDVPLPGPAPAWLIPGTGQGPWVIHVHGLGGRRATGLRTAPFFHRLGCTQLLISFRGDPDAPPTPDGKHHLGLSELADVEAALDYAAAHGAGSIIISGWSMGATMALAAAHTSGHRDLITGLVLTAPVLDWHRTLFSHTASRRLPAALAIGVLRILGGPLHRFAGLAQPLDLRTLDFTAMAPPVPAIILHGVGDASTPIRISEDYAARFPDLVSLVRFPACRHTQEWNSWSRTLGRRGGRLASPHNAGSLYARTGPVIER